MSGDAMAAHLAALRTTHVQRVLTDIQMFEHGMPLTKDVLVERWLTARPNGLTRAHLMAARREVAAAYHPDRGGSAALMSLANEAIDAAIARLDAAEENPTKEVADGLHHQAANA